MAYALILTTDMYILTRLERNHISGTFTGILHLAKMHRLLKVPRLHQLICTPTYCKKWDDYVLNIKTRPVTCTVLKFS